MSFSSQARQVVASFAANLGLPAVPAADDSYSFVFERTGTLTFTSALDGERTLVSLQVRPHRLDEDLERQILSLAGPDVSTNRFLSAGLTKDDQVMFVVAIEDSEMNLPTIEQCLQQLLAARADVIGTG